MSRPAPADAAAAALAAAFGLALALFAWQPTLATFADDSVSYLVMAQVFSPFQPASPAVAAAFAREAFYPPLFPLLLALAGAAHDLAWAHALVALLLAAALPLAYRLGVRWLESRGAALAALACIALAPSLWINARGILSETLFCLLLVSTFLVLEQEKNASWKLGVLMAAMALTRTAALPMIVTYGLWAAVKGDGARGDLRARLRAAAPALAALAAYGLWVLVQPSQTEGDYAGILRDKGQGLFGGPAGFGTALAASLLRQANAIAEGWAGSLLVYWIEGRPLRFALASAVGLLAVAGVALRMRRGKADGWMAAAYLATLLAWPFYEQMERFLFPLLPVLLLYAFLAAGAALRAASGKPALAHTVLAALLLTLVLPAMAFFYQRAHAEGRVVEINDWYRTPDPVRARLRAEVHLRLMDDMNAIRELTPPEARVMWVAPAYVALLAGRRGLAAPDPRLAPEAYRDAVRASGADYVFLSRYHPRDTLRDTAWQAGVRALSDGAKAVHTSTQDNGSIVSSVLLKVGK
ncbi:MAG TPA: hypothetical protein VI229_07185 [Burkholderiales bacterium]